MLFLSACTVGGSTPASRNTASNPPSSNTNTTTPTGVPRNVVISWTANRERAVNMAGGGYRVYYSQTNGFSTGSATGVAVPYSSGGAAPTSTTLPMLASGTYYYRVVAYSSFNPTGVLSSQSSFVVP